MEWIVVIALVGALIWLARNWIEERLFERKQAKEAWDSFQADMKLKDSLPDPEGKRSESGLPICPHCGHKLSLIEAIQGERSDGLPHIQCPSCSETFKF